MEADEDMDAHLMEQFRSMGTTDKDVLVAELQKLIGRDVNPRVCAFFLDMNDWNLHAAVCAYYDLEQPIAEYLPLMTLVRDITIGEGESVQPNVRFTKTWRIKNTGAQAWPPGCSLRFLQGYQFGHADRALVGSLEAGEEADVSVEMTSPHETGIYQGQWRMCTALGTFFGDIIWIILSVAEDGLLSVTQQLSKFGADLVSTGSTRSPAGNPFQSPGLGSSPVQPFIGVHAQLPDVAGGASGMPLAVAGQEQQLLAASAEHSVQQQQQQPAFDFNIAIMRDNCYI